MITTIAAIIAFCAAGYAACNLKPRNHVSRGLSERDPCVEKLARAANVHASNLTHEGR